MDASEIRRRFTDFFVHKNHLRVASAPLVAPGDPTLLFTSAGMVPFKPYFLEQAEPPSRRLTSIQKCFRTTDMDEVGDDSHLTFFEMMGNFSFGDYFKADAQAFAWELVTRELGLPPERLVTTVYLDDDEAFDIWRKIGVLESKIFRYGEAEGNYWFAGEDGPCGPCSEIYFDYGSEVDDGRESQPSDETGRYLEIWNLVFMQFLRGRDGTKTPLPAKNIDTGAGLERWAMVLQEKRSLYETDLFTPILAYVAGRCDRHYEAAAAEERRALRVITEHGRAVTFLIADGVLPGNEGRGYVLRRLIRRALYMAHTLGIDEPLLADVAGKVRAHMAPAYPELREQAALVDGVLAQEEERFRRTLETGHRMLEAAIDSKGSIAQQLQRARQGVGRPDHVEAPVDPLIREVRANIDGIASRAGTTDSATIRLLRTTIDAVLHEIGKQSDPQPTSDQLGRASQHVREITGAEAFLLYDTYGFPSELTREVAARANLGFDQDGFEAEMARQQQRGRAAAEFRMQADDALYTSIGGRTEFLGYERTRDADVVRALIVDGRAASQAQSGDLVEVILERTPFYPEGGGQVGDAGRLLAPNGEVEIRDTQARGDLIVHVGGVIRGALAVGESVEAVVDRDRRHDVMRNHTATHLLHAALRQVLGEHVRQAGSLVAPDHLRFDYTQSEPPAAEQLRAVQRLVNARIRDVVPVGVDLMPYDRAIDEGAVAIFGEKYGADVRVVHICDPDPATHDCFSKELCGGTHTPTTGFIGSFQIVSEGGVGAGVRRIEALTGAAAETWQADRLQLLNEAAEMLRSPAMDVPARLRALQEELEGARRRLAAADRSAGVGSAETLLAQAQDVDGVKVVAGRVDVASVDALRRTGDEVRRRLGSGVIVLGAVAKERPTFVAMVSDDLVQAGLHAGRLIKEVAARTGGGGGGRPEMAQAGGKDASRLDEALAATPEIVRAQRAG